MTYNEISLGSGIKKTSARPTAVFVDINGNEYICNVECIEKLDPNRSFEDQMCPECKDNPIDVGG